MKILVATACAGVLYGVYVSWGCATTTFDTVLLSEDPYCIYMKEICAESEEFEQRFRSMSGEEKEEAETIMKAYRYQCNQAIESCRRQQRAQRRKGRRER